MVLTSSDKASEMTRETAFNQKLQQHVVQFAKLYKDANIKLVNTYCPFEEALNNPKKYHARDNACSNADGVSCLWMDHLHPGVAIHKLVAEKVASIIPSFFDPWAY